MKAPADDLKMQQYIDYFYDLKDALIKYDKSVVYYHFEEEFEIEPLEVQRIIAWLLENKLLAESTRNSFIMSLLGQKCASNGYTWAHMKAEVLDSKEAIQRTGKQRMLKSGQRAKDNRFGWLPIGLSVTSLIISISLPFVSGKPALSSEKYTYEEKMDSLTRVVENQRVLLEHFKKPVELGLMKHTRH